MSVTMLCTECSRPARGTVAGDGEVPAHWCGQCAEHCAVAVYVRWRQSELDAQRSLGVWS